MTAACIRCAAPTAFLPPAGARAGRAGAPAGRASSARRARLARRAPSRRVRFRMGPDVPPEESDAADRPLDMEVLRRRMTDVDRKTRAGWKPSDAVIDLSAAMADGADVEEAEEEEFMAQFEALASLWVIVFTNVEDGSEGVYSITVGEENIVLAFEMKEDAQRYSLCLEAQEFPSPQVCELDSRDLGSFCGDAGFRLGFVPKGSLITPPDESAVDDLDKWRGKPRGGQEAGLSEEDIETMKKRLDSLFGQ